AVEALVPAVLGRFGRIDALINNAAIDPGRQEPTGQQLADLIAVNLLAPMRLASGFVASWTRSGTSAGGRIVNISSIQARYSRAGRSGYVAAKGGLEAWTRQLAVELGPLGVTVNAVAPGFVDVPRTQALLSPSEHAALASRIPARRAGTPADVANLVAFLCSPDAAYINGELITIDGGSTCQLPSHAFKQEPVSC
ncbi:MAG: SDR family oxidoreductase, partial [Planctomycetota bacterium]